MSRLIALALTLSIAAACGGSTTTPTSTGPVMTGTWSGTVTTQTGLVIGNASMTAQQTASDVQGTWTFRERDGTLFDSGFLSGFATVATATLTLTPTLHPLDCAYRVNALFVGPGSLSGPFERIGRAGGPCTTNTASGRLSFTKQ